MSWTALWGVGAGAVAALWLASALLPTTCRSVSRLVRLPLLARGGPGVWRPCSRLESAGALVLKRCSYNGGLPAPQFPPTNLIECVLGHTPPQAKQRRRLVETAAAAAAPGTADLTSSIQRQQQQLQQEEEKKAR